jgi:hypothetical protein
VLDGGSAAIQHAFSLYIDDRHPETEPTQRQRPRDRGAAGLARLADTTSRAVSRLPLARSSSWLSARWCSSWSATALSSGS